MNEDGAALYSAAANCENPPFVGAAGPLWKWAHRAGVLTPNFIVFALVHGS